MCICVCICITMVKSLFTAVTINLIWYKWRVHHDIAKMLMLAIDCNMNKLVNIYTTEYVSHLARTAWDSITARAPHPTGASRARRRMFQMITADRPPGSASWFIAACRVLWLGATSSISWMKYFFSQDGSRGTVALTTLSSTRDAIPRATWVEI